MPLSSLIEAFSQNLMTMGSLELTLVQNATNEPIAFFGSGAITQEQDGSLSFKLTAQQYEKVDPAIWFQAGIQIASGQVIPESAFYRLSFVDQDGIAWEAPAIFSQCSFVHTPVPYGAVDRIFAKNDQEVTLNYRLQVHFFDKVELPIWPILNGVGQRQVSTSIGELLVTQSETGVVFEIESDTPIRADLGLRIEEALRFLTAQDVSIRVLYESSPSGSQCEFRKRHVRSSSGTRMPPPIETNNEAFLDHGWTLFVQYLEFALQNGLGDEYWHDITYHVHNACACSAGSMTVTAVGVSVAVEGLASLVDLEMSENDKAKHEAFREWILDVIAKDSRYSSYGNRVKGFADQLFNIRASDRLTHLTSLGVVTTAYSKAWGKLRNKQVHPTKADIKNVAMDEVQDLSLLIDKVTTLMYEIVFYHIGYEGPYSDYGQLGHPIKRLAAI